MTAATATKDDDDDDAKNVLDPGTVESRGSGGGSEDNDDNIAKEIELFLQEHNFSLWSELKCLLNTFVFVTSLPVCPSSWAIIHPGLLMKGMCYFPAVGMVVGILVAHCFDFGIQLVGLGLSEDADDDHNTSRNDVSRMLMVVVVAAMSTALSLKITGCLHEDGLADTADGLGGGWTKAQILRIMTDSRLGTFGSAALILYLITKLHVLAALGPSEWQFCFSDTIHGIIGSSSSADANANDNHNNCTSSSHGAGPALIVAHTVARWTAPYLIWRCNYIEEDGPKSQFYSFMIRAKFLVSVSRVILSFVFCYMVTATLYGSHTAIQVLLLVWIYTEIAGWYGRNKLEGVMGDFLGGTICLAELLIYILVFVLTAAGAGRRPEDSSSSSLTSSIFDDCLLIPIMTLWNNNDPTKNNNSSNTVSSSSICFQNTKFRLLAQFIIVVVGYQLWCCFIRWVDSTEKTPPQKLKTSSSDTEKNANTIGGEPQKTSSSSASVSPQKEEAQKILALSSQTATTATVMEKYQVVQAYLDVLAKPVGSLGALEEWAARIAVLQGTVSPHTDHVKAVIFAGDHGVAASKDNDGGGEGCSLYPQAVTRAILAGLQQHVAGASVLAQGIIGLDNLSVIDVGVIGDAYPAMTTSTTTGRKGEGRDTRTVVQSSKHKLPNGTRNFCLEPAMTIEEVDRCIGIGKEVIADIATTEQPCQIVALGEVGIGNTTTASTLVAALTGKPVADLCGGGAFASRTADKGKIQRKIEIVETALKKHTIDRSLDNESFQQKDAITILALVGGSEVAALVGAMIEASERNIAILVDGFIVTVAALVAVRMKPSVCNALFLATKSAEQGQIAAIEQIQDIAREHNLPVPASPVLSMGLRMGECTGALLAVPILQSSAAMVSNMATIQDILG